MTEKKDALQDWLLHVKNRPFIFPYTDAHSLDVVKMQRLLNSIQTWYDELVGKTQALQKQHEDVFQALIALEDWVTGKHLGDFNPELVCILEKARKVLGK